MNRHAYPSDVTDAQWEIMALLLPKPNKVPGGPGRPPADVRLIVNAIFYQAKAGDLTRQNACPSVYRTAHGGAGGLFSCKR